MNIEIVEEICGKFYNTNILDYPCSINIPDKRIEEFVQILKDFLVTHHTIKSMCNMKNFIMTIRNDGDIIIDVEMVNQDTKQRYGSGCKIGKIYFINNDKRAIEFHIRDTFYRLLDY